SGAGRTAAATRPQVAARADLRADSRRVLSSCARVSRSCLRREPDACVPCGAFLRLFAVADLDEGQELAAGSRIAAEGAEHVAGDHGDAALVDAARRHALVDGLD